MASSTSTQPNQVPIRLTLSGDIKPQGVLAAVLLIGHAMETGYRVLESGKRVPKNVIETVLVKLGEQVIFSADVSIGISAHPYLAFPVHLPTPLPDAGLALVVTWRDDQGQTGSSSRLLQKT